jgi:hypothetical protein
LELDPARLGDDEAPDAVPTRCSSTVGFRKRSPVTPTSPYDTDQAPRFAAAQLREVPFTHEVPAAAAVRTYRVGE